MRSDDILGSLGNVNQIPKHMDQSGMHFLNAMNAIGWDDETIVGHLRETAAVLAGPSHSEHLALPGFLERIDQIRRFAARAHGQRDIARLAEQTNLINENTRI